MVGMEMIQSAVKLREFLVWSDIRFVAGWAFFFCLADGHK